MLVKAEMKNMTDNEKAIEQAKNEMLPFESWERLMGESSRAFAAFCCFRDLGAERNIRTAVNSSDKDEAVRAKRYRVWRNWCSQFRWRERAADYDSYTEKLKQGEKRKTIEAQGEQHRRVTGKMLAVVEKKLDLMNPADLTLNHVTEWAQAAIKAERDIAGFSADSNKAEPKQGEFTFSPEFQGL